ncbi:MAG TPA: SRPBCC family protein [Acidimicrobiales bacterium]|nr:SRPBCC family protein [Acidimicrobiales bacterium]
MQGEASTHIAAPPELVYDLVADVTNMGRWSPETRNAKWVKGATGPAAGARFRGINRWGPLIWFTTPKVLVADRGREFTFVVMPLGREGTRWSYRFTPTPDGGTDATESFEVIWEPPPLGLIYGTGHRRDVLIAGMTETLSRLKAAAENRSGSGAAG